jgi:hypothetical protein
MAVARPVGRVARLGCRRAERSGVFSANKQGHLDIPASILGRATFCLALPRRDGTKIATLLMATQNTFVPSRMDNRGRGRIAP